MKSFEFTDRKTETVPECRADFVHVCHGWLKEVSESSLYDFMLPLSGSQSFQNNLKICHRITMTSRQKCRQLNQRDLPETGTIKPSAVGGDK